MGDKAFQGFRNIRITESTRAFPISEDESYQLKLRRLVVGRAFGLLKGKFKRFDVGSYSGERNKEYESIIWCTVATQFYFREQEPARKPFI